MKELQTFNLGPTPQVFVSFIAVFPRDHRAKSQTVENVMGLVAWGNSNACGGDGKEHGDDLNKPRKSIICGLPFIQHALAR